jgi:hypothetical protein
VPLYLLPVVLVNLVSVGGAPGCNSSQGSIIALIYFDFQSDHLSLVMAANSDFFIWLETDHGISKATIATLGDEDITTWDIFTVAHWGKITLQNYCPN